MTALRVIASSSNGTAHPPLPRQPSNAEWQANRRHVPLWKRIFSKD